MRRLALAALLIGSALPALARDISGEVAYLPRIALDPSAELMIEVSGPAGITGEFRAGSDGAQVPLPFTVSTGDTGAQFLRAAIHVGGVAQWVSQPVAVPAGEDALDLGTIMLERFVPLGFASRMRCGDTIIDLGFAGDEARMRVGGVVHVLPQAISASGARYSDGQEPETMVWTKGNMATVVIAGQELPECEAVAVPATLPLTARGNEPGWVLNLSMDGMVLARQDGSEIRTPLPPAEDGPAGTVLASGDLVVTLAPGLCHDTMTGMPYPQTVTIRTGSGDLAGCGGDPRALLEGNWRLREMNGEPLPAEAEVTLGFAAGGLFGKAACNRYNAGVALSGEGLTITPGAMTMMACEEATMTLERAFIDTLATVTGFDLDPETGALILTAAEQPVLTAGPDL